MSLEALLYIVGGVCFILIIYTFLLHRKVSLFTKGKDAKTLEDTIRHLIASNEELLAQNVRLINRIETLEGKAKKSVRTIQTVRFNPFSDAGSNQSFATSLVNEEGDGVVLSSLYSRDRVSIFAKPVAHYTSEYELSGEEKTVLSRSAESYKAS